jgi:hypothetical protein
VRAVGWLVALACAGVACTQARQLKISEVGAGRLELYLLEDSSHHLDLGGQTLTWAALDSTGALTSGQIPLVSGLDGGQFLVLWEDPQNSVGPATASYNNFFGQSVLGVSVPVDSLGPVDPLRSYSFRVHGRQFRYIFPFFYTYDETDDEVRFGPTPRPSLGGQFSENGLLQPVERTPTSGRTRGKTLRRVAPVNDIPVDRDREADWTPDDESWGTAK